MPKPSKSIFMAPFWGRGFRPFFFFGALLSVISVALWGGFYAGIDMMPTTVFNNPVSWHTHEMIYGFTMAIVAGFLLTAVANWTGGAPVRQVRLIGLCTLWLIGRIVMSVDLGLPAWSIIVLEALFLPALAISLAIPLLRSWNKRNFVFLTLLSVLFACDLWFLLSEDLTALYVAIMMILMMVSLIGGRIIPAFTVAALRRKGLQAFQTSQGKTDIAALLSLAVVALCLVFAKETIIISVVAMISCFIHAARMRYYHTTKVFNDPLLWILHAGYAWLVIGLALLGLTGFGLFDTSSVIHLLTIGCIGSMTLGMICRVTLGHTGRAFHVGFLTVLSFYAMQIAALIRVLGPELFPEYTMHWIICSALLWAFCYAAYLVVFSTMLFGPRPDKKAA